MYNVLSAKSLLNLLTDFWSSKDKPVLLYCILWIGEMKTFHLVTSVDQEIHQYVAAILRDFRQYFSLNNCMDVYVLYPI